MTVYKAIKKEADAAAELAIALAKGETRQRPARRSRTPSPARTSRPSCSSRMAIYKDNVKDVVDDGFVTKAELCTGAYAAPCTAAGIC